MNKQSTRMARQTREQWLQLVKNYSPTDLDLKTYCDQAGVTTNRFKIWQRRFDNLDVSAPAFKELRHQAVPNANHTTPAENSVPQWDVELAFGSGLLLRIRQR